MTTYSLNACENLIQRYVERGGEIITLKEGCLGLGLMLLCGHNLKTTIINEVYLNAWNCGHTIRKYNKMPNKYEKMLGNL